MQENITENITMSLEEYNKLIEARQKANQYKKYFLQNTENSKFNRVLCAIERKNLFELIEEERKGE